MGIVIFAGFGFLFILVPLILTGINVFDCFIVNRREKLISIITILYGALLFAFLFKSNGYWGGDWYVQLEYSIGFDYPDIHYHNIISSDYTWLLWIFLPGIASYLILLLVKAEKLPPLLSSILIAVLTLMNVFSIVLAIQMGKNFDFYVFFLYLYQFNVLLLSARAIQLHMLQMAEIFKERATDSSVQPKLTVIFKWVNSLLKYGFLVFLALFFLVAMLEIIFVMAGQGLDAPIKAFTDTADWTFSQQIPPPPIEYSGHYLCTVAAGGHKKVVKPLRLGTRHGATIVVNRQLCIANAFEEVISEKFPAFHKWIRHVYDTYGYPLSNKITTPTRADFTYFVMKPLEWCFLIFLYLVDLRPEARINKQYSYQNSSK